MMVKKKQRLKNSFSRFYPFLDPAKSNWHNLFFKENQTKKEA